MRSFCFTIQMYMSQVITLDDLTAYMPTTTVDGGLGQQVVDGVNNWIDTQTGRCFGETKQVTETYDWSRKFYLRHMDIVSVDEIKLGYPNQTQTVLDPTGYWANTFGRVTMLWRTLGSVGPSVAYNDWMHVKYTYGLTTVPDDLKMAALGIASGFYNWVINGNRDVAGISVGSYHLEYTNKRSSPDAAPNPATSTADANWQVIQSYKLRRQ